MRHVATNATRNPREYVARAVMANINITVIPCQNCALGWECRKVQENVARGIVFLWLILTNELVGIEMEH